jgi:uncharacterized protein YcbK (DUF882 family)
MRKPSECSLPRRKLLTALAVAPFGAAVPRIALASDTVRTLSFQHLHTHERLEVTYFERGEYLEEALTQIDSLLRDFRTGEVARIDPALLDILHTVGRTCERTQFEVISAYRSPATNSSLADKSSGVSRNSLHLQGRAIDVRLSGYDTAKLRHACVALKLGGVGYYPQSDFVHLDTGRVRAWGPAS